MIERRPTIVVADNNGNLLYILIRKSWVVGSFVGDCILSLTSEQVNLLLAILS